MNNIKLSVVTINLNNAKGLELTVQSLKSQSWKDFELIVIDGGSTDNSKEVISANNDIVGHWVSEPDKGIYDAQNKGVRLATGEYLLFLNSGDRLYETSVFEKVVPQLSANICYGNMVQNNSGDELLCEAPLAISLDHVMNSTFWHPSTFIKRSLFIYHGFYKTDFKLAGDYEFFVRCYLKPGVSFRHLPFTVALFDGSGQSNDPANAALLKKERTLAWEMNLSGYLIRELRFFNWLKRSRYMGIIMFLEKLRGQKRDQG